MEDEEKKTNEEEKTKQNEIFSEDVSPIEEAKKILEETKKNLVAISEERKKIEKATAELLVNGRSFAGQKPQISEEERKKKSAMDFWAGTDIATAIEKLQ